MDPITITSTFIAVIELGREGYQWIDNLRPAINKAYHRALNKWNRNNIVRIDYAHKQLSIEQLPEYIVSKRYSDFTKNSFLECFEKELREESKTNFLLLEILSRENLTLAQDTNSCVKGIDQKLDAGFDKSSEEHKELGRLIKESAVKTSIVNPIPQKAYSDINDYIPRTVKEDDASNWDVYFTKTESAHSLSWHITNGAKHIVLYSDAQIGKSTELRMLAFQLYDSGLYNPYIFDLSMLSINEHIESQVEINRRFFGDKIGVLILDGLDEIPDSHRANTVKEIAKIPEKHPTLHIVIACRANYLATSHIPEFSKLHLNQIGWDEAIEYINNKYENGGALIKEIEENQYYEFSRNPFLLKECIEIHKNHGVLPKNKAAIYEQFIDKSLMIENNRGKNKQVPISVKAEVYPIIKRIAFCLQVSQCKNATMDELYIELKINREELNLCISNPLFHCDKDKNVEFVHNSFKEYIVAKHLLEQSFERFKELVCYKDSEKVMPSMYNTSILMFSMIGADVEKSKPYMDWLISTNENRQLLIRCGTEMLDEQQRNSVFNEIFNDYKQKRIWLEYYNGEALVNFANTRNTLLFVLNEISESVEYDQNTINAFKLLEYSDFRTLSPEEHDTAEGLILDSLAKYKDCKYADYLCEVFKNKSFIRKGLEAKVFEIIKDSEKYVHLYDFFGLLRELDVCDNYADWIFGKSEYIDSYYEDGCSHSVSRDNLFEVFRKFHKTDNIIRTIAHLNKDIFKNERSGFLSTKSYEAIALEESFKQLSETERINDDLRVKVIEQIQSIESHEFTDSYVAGCRYFINKATDTQALFLKHYELAKHKFLEICLHSENGESEQTRKEYRQNLNIVALLITEDQLEYIFQDDTFDEQYKYRFCGWFSDYTYIEQNIFDKIKQQFVHLRKLIDWKQQEQDEFDILFDRTKIRGQILTICMGSKDKTITYRQLCDAVKRNGAVRDFIWNDTDNETNLINTEDIEQHLADDDHMMYFTVNQLFNQRRKNVSVSDDQKRTITQIVIFILDNRANLEGIKLIISIIVNYDIAIDQDRLLSLMPYSYLRVSEKHCDIHFRHSNTYLEFLVDKISDKTKIDNVIIEIAESSNNYSEALWCVLVNYIVSYKRTRLYPYFELLLSKVKESRADIIRDILNLGREGIDITKPLLKHLDNKSHVWYYSHILQPADKCILSEIEKQEIREKLEQLYEESDISHEEILRLLMHLSSEKALDWCLDYAKLNLGFAKGDHFPSLMFYSPGFFERIKEYYDFAITLTVYRFSTHSIIQSSLIAMKNYATISEDLLDNVVYMFRNTANTNKEFAYLHREADEAIEKYLELHHGEITLKQAYEKFTS